MKNINPLVFVFGLFVWFLVWLSIFYYFSEKKQNNGEP